MGKKKKYPELDEILSQPWCYYCERPFPDLKILISHQKAKHFKCDRCGRRLNTAGGLSVHLNQVHKENLTKVENALPDREGLGVEIFGMEGIPEEIKMRHDKRVVEQYFKEQTARREATGNPPPGSKEALAPKPSKFGDDDDLLKRFKQHMAKVESGEVVGAGGPMEGVQSTSTQVMPTAASPDQAQPFAPPGFPGQPPIGFPPGQIPFPGQLPFQQPPFAGAPPFPQGLSPTPLGMLAPRPGAPAFQQAPPPTAANGAIQAGIDELIANAQAAASAPPPVAVPAAAPATATAAVGEKKAAKGKGNMQLIYSDNEISPEEKMAMLPRYAYSKA